MGPAETCKLGTGVPVAPIPGKTVGVGGVVTHEVCYTGVIGRLKEHCAVPHILGSLGGAEPGLIP